jgi:hypothetical protein
LEENSQDEREEGSGLAVVLVRRSTKRELTPDGETLKGLMYICNISHWVILKIPRPIYAGKIFFLSGYKQEMEHY